MDENPAVATSETDVAVPKALPGGAVRLGFVGLLAASWLWAFMACMPFWERDPNYAYGWSVPPLMAFFLWRRLSDLPSTAWTGIQSRPLPGIPTNRWILALPALAILPAEVYRNEYVQSGLFLWLTNLWAISVSLAAAGWLGGRRLLVAVSFPILFHLTAVPWPGVVALPVQQGLMQAVAQIVSSVLLWIGIPVTLQGAQLHLANGVVGIVEACSGIRSLQTSIMVGLAIGELQMLTRGRRLGLLSLGVLLAFITNLGRTFSLCWIMDRHGDKAMHAAHDPVGNVAMYSLLGMIYLGGRILETPESLAPRTDEPLTWSRRWQLLNWNSIPDFRPFLAVGIATALLVHGWYFALRVSTRPQVSGVFSSKIQDQTAVVNHEFSDGVWRELGADIGEQFDISSPDAPHGKISIYHLFWKPGPKTLMALGHRPDICMPGAGWSIRPDVGRTRIEFNGVPMDFLVFTFDRPDSKISAIQIWGVWRNGTPVEMDYGRELRVHPEVYGFLPSGRHLMGIEILSAFVTFEGDAPGLELFQQQLPKYFDIDKD